MSVMNEKKTIIECLESKWTMIHFVAEDIMTPQIKRIVKELLTDLQKCVCLAFSVVALDICIPPN